MSEFNLKLDYYSLLNLHKALLEAKFNMNPDNEMVSGSPFVADIYAEVRDMLIESDSSGQWQEWFQLRHRPDYRQRAIMRMKKNRRWEKASPVRRREIAEHYLAPFLYNEAELDEVMAEMAECGGTVDDKRG